MPNGKWAWFLTNSHNETKMRANDGIYTADKDSRNRVVITRMNGSPLEDFYKNAEFKGSKKINLSWTAQIQNWLFKKENTKNKILYLDSYY